MHKQPASQGLTATLIFAAVILVGPVSGVHASAASQTIASAPSAVATDDRQLRALRKEAQRERQQQRKQRNQQLADAARTFRADTGNLAAEYRERARTIDTEFSLEEVGLNAELDAEVAGLEAELQKRMGSALTAGNESEMMAHLQTMGKESAEHQNRIFEARKQGAVRIQEARLRARARRDTLFLEMDEQALQRAAALGLTWAPDPILATPVGGEMTRSDEQWNDREFKEIERIRERHAGLLSEFANGERLRAWERANLEQDFTLEWEERSELQALQSQQTLFTTFLMQPTNGGAPDGQSYIDQLADIGEQQRLIKIRFEQIRQENTIRRREEKRSLNATRGEPED